MVITDTDDGYIRLASCILYSQMERYRNTLRKYNMYRTEDMLNQVKLIENELKTPYYAILSMQKFDFAEYIDQQHEKYSIPKFEEKGI